MKKTNPIARRSYLTKYAASQLKALENCCVTSVEGGEVSFHNLKAWPALLEVVLPDFQARRWRLATLRKMEAGLRHVAQAATDLRLQLDPARLTATDLARIAQQIVETRGTAVATTGMANVALRHLARLAGQSFQPMPYKHYGPRHPLTADEDRQLQALLEAAFAARKTRDDYRDSLLAPKAVGRRAEVAKRYLAQFQALPMNKPDFCRYLPTSQFCFRNAMDLVHLFHPTKADARAHAIALCRELGLNVQGALELGVDPFRRGIDGGLYLRVPKHRQCSGEQQIPVPPQREAMVRQIVDRYRAATAYTRLHAPARIKDRLFLYVQREYAKNDMVVWLADSMTNALQFIALGDELNLPAPPGGASRLRQTVARDVVRTPVGILALPRRLGHANRRTLRPYVVPAFSDEEVSDVIFTAQHDWLRQARQGGKPR
jgi:hypothetical protein